MTADDLITAKLAEARHPTHPPNLPMAMARFHRALTAMGWRPAGPGRPSDVTYIHPKRRGHGIRLTGGHIGHAQGRWQYSHPSEGYASGAWLLGLKAHIARSAPKRQ